MSVVNEFLEARKIPNVLEGVGTKDDFEKKQDKIRKLLTDRQFGEIPAKPEHMFVESDEPYENFAAGKAVRKHLTFNFEMDGKSFSFPAMSVIPKGKQKCPAFVFIGFEKGEATKYMPTEEIVERGFALFTFCYNDVSRDNNNFKDGIAKYLVKSRRKSSAPSKITLWAWAAMRVMDYIEMLGEWVGGLMENANPLLTSILVDGIIGGTYSYDCPNAKIYKDEDMLITENVINSKLSINMLVTPEDSNWSYKTHGKNAFTSTFQSGQKASLLLHISSDFYTREQDTTILYVIRNESGDVLMDYVSQETMDWQLMWSGDDYRYCELNIPSIPTEPGKYSLYLYFNNGAIAIVDFSVTA